MEFRVLSKNVVVRAYLVEMSVMVIMWMRFVGGLNPMLLVLHQDFQRREKVAVPDDFGVAASAGNEQVVGTLALIEQHLSQLGPLSLAERKA